MSRFAFECESLSHHYINVYMYLIFFDDDPYTNTNGLESKTERRVIGNVRISGLSQIRAYRLYI